MENANQKVVKSKRTPKKPIVQFLSIIAICISCTLLYGVVSEVSSTLQLKKQLEKVELELATIKNQNAQLTSQREKLEDPGYVQNYARGNYMLSKEGEQIFYLPGSGDE